MTVTIHGVEVHGVEVDGETRCAHYRTALDVIAIRFGCCDRYYPCFECHEALADHEARVWPGDRAAEPAVLCGACGHQMTAGEYLASDHTCPICHAAFNPGCAQHRTKYFSEDL